MDLNEAWPKTGKKIPAWCFPQPSADVAADGGAQKMESLFRFKGRGERGLSRLGGEQLLHE